MLAKLVIELMFTKSVKLLEQSFQIRVCAQINVGKNEYVLSVLNPSRNRFKLLTLSVSDFAIIPPISNVPIPQPRSPLLTLTASDFEFLTLPVSDYTFQPF